MAEDEPIGRVATTAFAGMAMTAVGLLGPEVSLVAAGALPVTISAGRTAVAWVGERRRGREEYFVRLVANLSGCSQDQLAEKIHQDPDLEELFIRTMRACGGTTNVERFIAFATSIGMVMVDQSDAEWENAFRQALEDLDHTQLTLLERMEGSVWQPTNRRADTQPVGDRSLPLDDIIGDLPNGRAALAALERNGLVTTDNVIGGYNHESRECFVVSEFGDQVLSRMNVIGEAVRASRSDD